MKRPLLLNRTWSRNPEDLSKRGRRTREPSERTRSTGLRPRSAREGAVEVKEPDLRNPVEEPSARNAPTVMLLWAACRLDPDYDGCEEARRLGADLALAARTAVAQRVSPLLWRATKQWATPDDEWSATLRDDWTRCRAQALIVRPRLRSELLEPLVAAGVEPLVIKGAALAGRYPEPGLRPMDDVDVVVRPDAHRVAAETLIRAGWEVTRRQGPSYSLSLAHPALPGLPVDLHLDLAAGADQVFRFTAADLWQTAQAGSLFGVRVLLPTPESELLLIATHAGKPFHNFDRLLWAVDAAAVIGGRTSQGESIDWIRLEELSRRAAARSALAVLLAQAGRLGADSPAALRRFHGAVARQRALNPLVSLTWPLEPRDISQRQRLTYAVIDDPWLRLRRLLHEINRKGLVRAPDRAVVVAWRILLRVLRLRRTA